MSTGGGMGGPRSGPAGRMRGTGLSAGETVADVNERRSMANHEGYCVKCKEKREFDGNEVTLANGRRAAQGTCPTCGTKMNRMLGKSA